ncbi:MAG: FAD-dependent oxidoreductase [Thermodesulfobacteriota bacterium]
MGMQHDDAAIPVAEVQHQLEDLFRKLPSDIDLLFFTSPARNPQFTELTRAVLRMLREITSRIRLREFDIDHDLARKHGVIAAPALLFNPESCSLRWYGAPAGEEGRTFIEILLLLGRGAVDLSLPARKVLDAIDTRRDIKVFVSPTCPYCPQQAINAVKAVLARPDICSLEIIDIQCNPDLADRYDAHSVPQVWANGRLIALGAQSEELFLSSLAKLEQQTVFIPDETAEEIDVDLLIVGGGPAGLTAGIYGARAGLRSVIVERDLLGGQVATTPVVENYPGLTQVAGKTLVDIMVTHALEYAKIFPGEAVVEIRPGQPLVVLTSRRKFTAKAVLLATGALPRKLGVPGEARFFGRGVSYCATCDGPLFKGKKVVMVGGGSSALTEAMHLANIGVAVTVIHRRDRFRAQDHLVRNFEAMGIPALFNSQVVEISGREKVAAVRIRKDPGGEESTMTVDGVFIAIGYEPTVDVARKIGVKLTAEGYIGKDGRHRTNVPGIYCAGDVEGGYKQIVTAAGQGAEAALAIFEDLVNPYWVKGKTGADGS